jgi:hypothetical protein
MDLGMREGPSPVESEEYALPNRRVAGTRSAISLHEDPETLEENITSTSPRARVGYRELYRPP